MEIAKTHALEADLTHILEQICNASGWTYGEVWLPDGDLLKCHAAHYMASEQLAEFRRKSEDFTFSAGAGLPGRVWMLSQPEWIENVSLEPAVYYRSYIARKAGLKTAVGLPVLARCEVLAVLVFYSDRAVSPDENAIAAFSDRVQSLIEEFRLNN